ncbi:hypothetical protein AVEN_236603-1 [Araneus ventricosus]|uniref:Uncharacterized protein n=1 Tax=Araneus ventricosus TaxID=182803 RepID=A0A4Y2Q0C7_ARAVE|nr:hypothetical protein AVEN_236603-1 [Araneus ventricosus]
MAMKLCLTSRRLSEAPVLQELGKKKRSAPTSTETPTPKRKPAKKKIAAVPLSNALENAKPKKNMVVHDPGHTCSKAQMEKDQ